MNAKFHLNDDLMHEERMAIFDTNQSSACNISCNHNSVTVANNFIMSKDKVYLFFACYAIAAHFSGECIVR